MRLLLLLAVALALPVHAETIRLTNGEWSPYMGEKLPHQGVASRIVSEAFASEGIEVQWMFYPWARALQSAELGKSAGAAVWRHNPEREQAFFVSDAVVESNYYLFHRKDQPFDWQTVDDLQGRRIGAAIDYDYGADFQAGERSGHLQVKRLSNEEQGLRMLLAGRLDVMPMDKVVAFDLLRGNFSREERAQLTFHPQSLRDDSLHLLLSRQVPGNEAMLERFNRGLKTLRDSGRVSQYLLDVQQPLSALP